jgi:hypothetical protein
VNPWLAFALGWLLGGTATLVTLALMVSAASADAQARRNLHALRKQDGDA